MVERLGSKFGWIQNSFDSVVKSNGSHDQSHQEYVKAVVGSENF